MCPILSRSGLSPRRLALAAAVVAGAALPALAAEPPFDPAAALAGVVLADILPGPDGAPKPGAETAWLRTGLLCAAWARDMIGQHWHLLDRLEGPGTWSDARQRLWLQAVWVDEFEARHLRPLIDADSQAELVRAWWPGGVATPAGSAEAIAMHGFCGGLPGLLGSVDPQTPYGL